MEISNDRISEILNDLDFIPGLVAVGGCVRDALLGLEFNDIDLASPIHPNRLIELLDEHGFNFYETGIDHGTITIRKNRRQSGRAFEVEHTTFRRDVSTDGRRATVEFADTFDEDAKRRDFTVNAMAVDKTGKVIDPFGGIEDLRTSTLDTVGDPHDRFEEDYLRILRALRFSVRFSLSVTSDVMDAINELYKGIPENVSDERVFEEFKKGIESPYGKLYLNDLMAPNNRKTFIESMFPFVDSIEVAKLVEWLQPTTLDQFLLCVFGSVDHPKEHFNGYPLSRRQKRLIRYFSSLQDDPTLIFDMKNRIDYKDLYIFKDDQLLKLYNLASNPETSNEELLEQGVEPRKIGTTQKERFIKRAKEEKLL